MALLPSGRKLGLANAVRDELEGNELVEKSLYSLSFSFSLSLSHTHTHTHTLANAVRDKLEGNGTL